MNEVRRIRVAAGISQVRLCRELGWKQSRLANYEAGRRCVALDAARKIVSALKGLGAECSLDDVFPPTARDPEAA